ncbi:MAG: DUF881 domain-containing protein [Clostridiales bacterium]|nr:DUF881 domain-containing protein [Clostridiales bacterium]
MNNKIIVMIVCFGVSFITTIQVRTVRIANDQTKILETKVKHIAFLLKKEREISDSLNQSIRNSLKKEEMYLKDDLGSEYDALKKEWESISKKAGLTDVIGQGIIITVNDAAHDVYTLDIVEDYRDLKDMVVHDMDLVCILNELKIHGCQAISINDERIISISEQMCAGTTVRVNKRRYTPPFEIKAIGDADRLFEGLNNSEYVNELRVNNIRVNIRKENELTVFKYKDDIGKLITGLEVSKR